MGRTRTRTAAGIVMDAGALIALDRGDKRMIALLDRALTQGRAFRVPAGVVGQAWRDGRVQVALGRFLQSEEVEIVPLDDQLARSCGELCGATNSSDVIDASVMVIRRNPAAMHPGIKSVPQAHQPIQHCRLHLKAQYHVFCVDARLDGRTDCPLVGLRRRSLVKLEIWPQRQYTYCGEHR